jgi:hypothetical protein
MGDNHVRHHSYWDSFYSGRAGTAVPESPSTFAEWVQARLEPEQALVELGFGNARDSLWFARQGRTVIGFDFAESAVDQAQGRADADRLTASFFRLDLYDEAAVRTAAEQVRAIGGQPAVYARFLVHALEEEGRLNLLRLCATVLAAGGALYLEFRTSEDSGQEHVFGDDHFRVFLSPAAVVEELEELGATVTHCEAGHGLAPYKDEDPHVARIVAGWAPVAATLPV